MNPTISIKPRLIHPIELLLIAGPGKGKSREECNWWTLRLELLGEFIGELTGEFIGEQSLRRSLRLELMGELRGE